MDRSAARAYLLAFLVTIAVYQFAPGAETAIYAAVGLTALGVTLVATLARRPPNATGWLTLTAAIFLFVCGDSAYRFDSRLPGPADGFYVAAYLVWLAAIVLLLRHERFARDRGAVLDAGIVTLSVSTAIWCVFLDERMPSAALLARLVSCFYVVADVVLLAVVISAAFVPGRRTAAFWWLVASIVVMPAADAAYVLPAAEHTAKYAHWMAMLWLFSYAATGVAALDPSMRSLTVAGPADAERLTVRRLYLLGASVMTLPVAAIASEVWNGFLDVTAIAGVGAVIVVLLTLRVLQITREVFTLRAQALESERRFRVVFERSPVGIAVERCGLLQETNPALQRMLGLDDGELAAMHVDEITHPDDVGGVTESGTYSFDRRYLTRSGEVHDAHVHVALAADDDLRISVIEDVTERRALEEQLRQAQRLEAVGKLAGGIAHDFNNLMTAVLGYSDLLLTRPDRDPGDRERIEAIRDAALRASDLTRQLLAFGRRQVMQPVEVDLCETVLELETLLRGSLGAAGRLETVVARDPVVVRADRRQLEQVLLNLVVNARDAMPGGGTVTISVRIDGNSALLTIADTGVGMDDDTASHMFEPFFTTKPVGEGSGLGLATVHGIVGQSGGSISVETEPGSGTVFSVRLPLVEPGSALPSSRTAASLVD